MKIKDKKHKKDSNNLPNKFALPGKSNKPISPVKRLQRKKFQPPTTKHAPEFNPNYAPTIGGNDNYSYGESGFANGQPGYGYQQPNDHNNPPQFDANEIANYMQDINKVIDEPRDLGYKKHSKPVHANGSVPFNP
jgi:hypothetical protein